MLRNRYRVIQEFSQHSQKYAVFVVWYPPSRKVRCLGAEIRKKMQRINYKPTSVILSISEPARVKYLRSTKCEKKAQYGQVER